VTAIPGHVLRPWLTQLAFWSGYPVDVVVSADASVEWAEIWTDALLAVPERHLRVRFVLPNRGVLP
jgi:hypothetical protein